LFQVFCRRLTAQQGLNFAGVLPSVLRAIFVQKWDVSQPPVPFVDRDSPAAEVKAVRPHHNLTPDNAIEATAWAVRRITDSADSTAFSPNCPIRRRRFEMWTWMIPPRCISASSKSAYCNDTCTAPSPSMDTVQVSPRCKAPTPAGVPV